MQIAAKHAHAKQCEEDSGAHGKVADRGWAQGVCQGTRELEGRFGGCRTELCRDGEQPPARGGARSAVRTQALARVATFPKMVVNARRW